MRTRSVLFLVAMLGLAGVGCGKSRTEAVVVVTSQGLRIPDDITAVHVQVFDAQNPTPPLWDQTYQLCNALIQTSCVSLPFTMTLIPGSHTPSDSTRVVVAAQRGQVDRIDDAAIFTFTPGESLRLDFILYGNCLDKLDCADINAVCGPDRVCEPIHPEPFHGEPDLAQGPQGPGDDLGAGVGDMANVTNTTDLASSDLAGQQSILDMSMVDDLHACIPACVIGSCAPSNCGTVCPCSPNTVCMNRQCVPCGRVSDQCCPGEVCNDGHSTCNIGNNMCECGNQGQACCAPNNTCNSAMLTCVVTASSATCQLLEMGMPPSPPPP